MAPAEIRGVSSPRTGPVALRGQTLRGGGNLSCLSELGRTGALGDEVTKLTVRDLGADRAARAAQQAATGRLRDAARLGTSVDDVRLCPSHPDSMSALRPPTTCPPSAYSDHARCRGEGEASTAPSHLSTGARSRDSPDAPFPCWAPLTGNSHRATPGPAYGTRGRHSECGNMARWSGCPRTRKSIGQDRPSAS